MEDPELAAIRAARMSQLQQNGSRGPTGEGGEDDSKRAAEEQMRRDLLATVLDTAARERCTPILPYIDVCMRSIILISGISPSVKNCSSQSSAIAAN